MSDRRESKRAASAANRAVGKCGCGRGRRTGGKTCQRCYDLNVKNTTRVRAYADDHGCTLADARVALRTRTWTFSLPSLIVSLLQGLTLSRGVDVFVALRTIERERKAILDLLAQGKRGIEIEKYLAEKTR